MFTSVSNTYLVPNSASKNCNTCFDCLCNLKINKCEIYKCVQLITNYIRGIFVQKVSLQIDRVPYWVTGRQPQLKFITKECVCLLLVYLHGMVNCLEISQANNLPNMCGLCFTINPQCQIMFCQHDKSTIFLEISKLF